MLIVVAITAVVGGALMSAINFFYRDNAYVFQEASAVQSARRGLTGALTDIRQATYGADGAYPIAAAATSSITIYADTDGNGTVEKVRYYLEAGTFYRGIMEAEGNPSSYEDAEELFSVLAENVRMNAETPIFRYADGEGEWLSEPINTGAIASVSMELSIDADPVRLPNALTLQGAATLRNLRY